MSKIVRILKHFCAVGAVMISLSLILSSCGNTRHLTYMQGQFDTAKLSQVPPSDPIIQKGDLISVIVYSDNQKATALYNQPLLTMAESSGSSGGGNSNAGGGTGSTSGALAGGVSAPSSPGYQVDEEGNIQFQGLGILHVEGLNKAGLKRLLDSRLKDTLLTNPYYSIRFLNYKFTILGEVQRTGIYNIPGERISMWDAIGLAGDLTFYGRRDNVLVIRESGGKREFQRLDLTKPEIMASPYYYLQQGDVVIIEANKRKVAASDQVTARNVTIGASIVSAIAIIYSIFRK